MLSIEVIQYIDFGFILYTVKPSVYADLFLTVRREAQLRDDTPLAL